MCFLLHSYFQNEEKCCVFHHAGSQTETDLSGGEKPPHRLSSKNGQLEKLLINEDTVEQVETDGHFRSEA